jgi:hypothetical protein
MTAGSAGMETDDAAPLTCVIKMKPNGSFSSPEWIITMSPTRWPYGPRARTGKRLGMPNVLPRVPGVALERKHSSPTVSAHLTGRKS